MRATSESQSRQSKGGLSSACGRAGGACDEVPRVQYDGQLATPRGCVLGCIVSAMGTAAPGV